MSPEPRSQARSPVSSQPPGDKPGVLGAFVLGVRVWAREMRRLFAGQARLHEVRQLEARLDEETRLLARLENAPGPERNLCLTQIEMLKVEIARLRAEEASRRAGPPRQPKP